MYKSSLKQFQLRTTRSAKGFQTKMDFNLELKKLKELNLPQADFVIVGSGSLTIRNIRGSKDLDIIVTPKLWNELIEKYKISKNEWGVETLSINEYIEILNPKDSLFGNSKVVPVDEIFNDADIIDGIKFINLDHLKKIKISMGREKDIEDATLIDGFLALK